MSPGAWKAGAAAAVVAAVALLWSAFAPPDTAPLPARDQAAPGAAAPAAPAPGFAAAPAATPPAAPASRAPEPPPAPAVPLGSNEVPDLQADAQGRLVVDAHTRDELEKLIALNDRAAAQALLQKLEASLPPAAYRQAVDAFFAYQNYSIAAAQLTSPVQPVTDEATALRQLDALHALRVQQLGPEVAQAYFGDEEATARRLLASMQAQPASGSSLTERAQQAERAANPGR